MIIHAMDIQKVDLNLLLVLDAMYRHRHVTRAGESLGLSQPAMSAVLARLRTDDRVMVITQSAVFAALLGLFLRQAKDELLPRTKRIFFLDLGQVIDSATPDSGGVWISRHAVPDSALFRVVDPG